MLQKSKSKKHGVVKYLLAIPVIVLSMTLFSTTVVAQETKKLEQKVEKVVEKKANPKKTETQTAPNSKVVPVYDKEKSQIVELSEVRSAEEVAKQIPFAVVEEVPMFKGCEGVDKSAQFDCFQKEMTNHIKLHFTYPKEAMENNIQGRVQVEYLIDEIGNVEVYRVKGPENAQPLEEEARRIIKLLPQFTPGKQSGKAIAVRHVVPITFRMQ